MQYNTTVFNTIIFNTIQLQLIPFNTTAVVTIQYNCTWCNTIQQYLIPHNITVLNDEIQLHLIQYNCIFDILKFHISEVCTRARMQQNIGRADQLHVKNGLPALTQRAPQYMLKPALQDEHNIQNRRLDCALTRVNCMLIHYANGVPLVYDVHKKIKVFDLTHSHETSHVHAI